MSVQNERRIEFVTLPTFLTRIFKHLFDHVGLKRVTYRIRYTTYIFNENS
jgi:hypothetical protein